MTDAVVTIVRCRRCGHTGHLVLRDGRFWCAWCQDWAAVTAESVENAIVSWEGGLAKLARRPPDGHPLQPLRIPAGWTVTYNNGLYEIDPPGDALDEEERWEVFKQDMLQMRHEGADRLLDLGWYPDGDTRAGQYGLVVYEGDFHGRLLHEFRGRDRAALVAEIERLLVLIAQGRL